MTRFVFNNDGIIKQFKSGHKWKLIRIVNQDACLVLIKATPKVS